MKAGPWVFTSGVLATDYRKGIPEGVRPNPGLPLHGKEDLSILEAEWIFDQLDAILEAAGSRLDLAVRVDHSPVSRTAIDPYHVVRRSRVSPPRPASTSVGVQGLVFKDCSIEVAVVALAEDGGVKKVGIETDEIPAPIGGYVPAIRAGDFLFLAGQLASDFRTGVPSEASVNPTFWEGSTIDRQAHYTLKNLALTLEAAGSSLENVIKAHVFLADLEDIPRFDRVWREFFPKEPPARTIIQGSAYGDIGAVVEITLVALIEGSATKKQVVAVDAPIPCLHESLVVKAGDFVLLSGLVAADYQGLVDAAQVDANVLGIGPRREAEHILSTADRLLRAAGSSADQIVRAETYMTDLHAYAAVEPMYQDVFGSAFPARTTVEVPRLHVPGCSVLMDLWAVAG